MNLPKFRAFYHFRHLVLLGNLPFCIDIFLPQRRTTQKRAYRTCSKIVRLLIRYSKVLSGLSEFKYFVSFDVKCMINEEMVQPCTEEILAFH